MSREAHVRFRERLGVKFPRPTRHQMGFHSQEKKEEDHRRVSHRLIQALPEPLNIMVLADGCFGLCVSELLALKWEDIDTQVREIMIQRKFTHGKLGQTKSDANLPISDALLKILEDWRPKTDGSERVFPSTRTGGVRSASMLLQKGIQPVARKIGQASSPPPKYLMRVHAISLRHSRYARSWQKCQLNNPPLLRYRSPCSLTCRCRVPIVARRQTRVEGGKTRRLHLHSTLFV